MQETTTGSIGTSPRPWAIYASAAAAAFAILITRRPDAFMRPQFWAEDGRNWFADAYNNGIFASLITPEAGYLQTFSRLAAAAAQAVPLEWAPAVFNLIAAALQVGIALFIISPRMRTVIADVRRRSLLAFLYLAMPHSFEVFLNVTNSQWHLALLSALIIVAGPGRTRGAFAFDLTVLSISALSGPFCILLLPVAALRYIARREKAAAAYLVPLAAGAAVQMLTLASSERPIQADLGAGIGLLLKIVGRHVFISPIIGSDGFRALERSGAADVASVAAAVAGTVAFIYVAWRGTMEIRLLLLYAFLIVAAALYSPAVTLKPGQWEEIASMNTAIRYWFIPTFAIYVVLLRVASQGGAGARVAAAGLAASLIGVAVDWRQPAFPDREFPRHAAHFRSLPPGAIYEIPVDPDGWIMRLKKK